MQPPCVDVSVTTLSPITGLLLSRGKRHPDVFEVRACSCGEFAAAGKRSITILVTL